MNAVTPVSYTHLDVYKRQFSGYAGGLGKLAGPTGGYLIGFIAMALIGGIVMEVSHRKPVSYTHLA